MIKSKDILKSAAIIFESGLTDIKEHIEDAINSRNGGYITRIREDDYVWPRNVYYTYFYNPIENGKDLPDIISDGYSNSDLMKHIENNLYR